MTVPGRRLLWLTALLVIPLATFTVLSPGSAILSLGALAGIFLVSCVDMVRAQRSLDGVTVEFPEVIRASKGREFSVEVKIRNEAIACHELSLGLALGEAFTGTPVFELRLPRDSEFAKHTWRLKALKRGCYRFDACYLESRSPLGLWNHRSRRVISCEMRVYPNLHMERRSLAALFLHRGNIGIHAQRQVGKGRDFEQLREYVPGDDYGDIFWKASARRGFPMTKMFQLERTQEIYVVVDHSRLSARELRVSEDGLSPGAPLGERRDPEAAAGAPPRDSGGGEGTGGADSPGGHSEMIRGGSFEVTTQLERFLHAALVMGLVAEQQGDLFGLITFGSQVDGFIRSRNGKAHYDACRDALYTLETEQATPDYEELVVFVRTHLTRRALLVVLTDLSDPLLAEQYLETMRLISRRHVVLTVMLKPRKAEPLFSHDDVESVDDLYDELAGHFTWMELQEISRTLSKQGVHFAIPDHEALCTEMVTEYLNIKRRQLL